MESNDMNPIRYAAASLLIAVWAMTPAAAQAQEKVIAVVCKAGGKMSARVRALGTVTVQFTAAAAPAKDADPGDGQCAYRDTAMEATNAPKKIRAKTADHGMFLTEKLLKGSKFEFQATNNGKGMLIITSIEPAPPAASQ